MKKFFREFRRINWPQTLFGSPKRAGITLILAIPILVGAASLGYAFYLSQNPAVVYSHKLQSMTDQISKSISLPTDETPVVATVTDTKILPKEVFFSYAKNGDKILMYKKHKLAILYRPSIGAVITQATLDFKDVTPTPALAQGSLPAVRQVAGASTSASLAAPTPTVVPEPSSAPTQQSSGTNTYQPQGKVLVAPAH